MQHFFDAYMAIKVLMNTWAFCGNFEVKSMKKEGATTIFSPHGQGVEYAEHCLRSTIERAPVGRQYDWLTQRDLKPGASS